MLFVHFHTKDHKDGDVDKCRGVGLGREKCGFGVGKGITFWAWGKDGDKMSSCHCQTGIPQARMCDCISNETIAAITVVIEFTVRFSCQKIYARA